MPPVSSAQAYQSLTAFKPRESKDVMGEAETKYDIPGRTTRLSNLRGLVGNLQSSVEAVDPSVTGRTSGNFTTEAQRSALVNREQAPILGSLAKQQQALGVEQSGFSDAQNLATQMASALMQDDQRTYQRLLDQYNTATAAEQAAEQKRQYEATLAEQRRQFDEQQRASAKASSGSGYDLSAISKYLQGAVGGATTPVAQKDKDAQYLGNLMAEKDAGQRLQLIATLRKQAKAGNAEAARKFELGKQLGYWKF